MYIITNTYTLKRLVTMLRRAKKMLHKNTTARPTNETSALSAEDNAAPATTGRRAAPMRLTKFWEITALVHF